MDIQLILEVALTLLVILAMTLGPILFGRYYKQQQNDTAALLESNEAGYSDKPGMLCSSFDEPDKGLVQFFGTILNADITPGMTLSTLGGSPWTVKTIYLDRNNPDATSSLAAAHTKDAAIVVDTYHNFDKKIFKEELVATGFVFLKLS